MDEFLSRLVPDDMRRLPVLVYRLSRVCLMLHWRVLLVFACVRARRLRPRAHRALGSRRLELPAACCLLPAHCKVSRLRGHTHTSVAACCVSSSSSSRSVLALI